MVSVRNLWVKFNDGVDVILVSRSAVEFGAFPDDTREEIDSSFWAKTAQNATCQLTLIRLGNRLVNENTRLILKMVHRFYLLGLGEIGLTLDVSVFHIFLFFSFFGVVGVVYVNI